MNANLLPVIAAIAGFFAGGLGVWLLLRQRITHEYQRARAESDAERATLVERLQGKDLQIRELRTELAQRDQRISELQTESGSLGSQLSALSVRLEEERKSASERLAVFDDAKQKLSDAFRALSAEALNTNSQMFLNHARETLASVQRAAATDLDTRQKAIGELVLPLQQSLDKVDSKIRELETARASAYSALHEQISQLASSQTQLQTETARLVNALRTPAVRGRWGEIQLKRVVELAGMLEYCDFTEQATLTTDDGRIRPDVIVRLPNKRRIVVDSKVPLQGFLDALEAPNEETRVAKLKDHGRQLRTHLMKLAAKSYWEQLDATPEFVVLFLPGETFFSAALEQDPSLIEFGVDQKVILATPTTLIALLKAVAYGWKQERIAANALEISELGRQLYERLRLLTGYFADVGKKLDGAVESYNRAVGSFESRVLVSARKFTDLDAATDKEIEGPSTIEKAARYVRIEQTQLIPGLLDDAAEQPALRPNGFNGQDEEDF